MVEGASTSVSLTHYPFFMCLVVVLLRIKKLALADAHQQWRFLSLFFSQINFPMSLGNLQPTLLPSNYITSSTIKHCAISIPFMHNWTVNLVQNFIMFARIFKLQHFTTSTLNDVFTYLAFPHISPNFDLRYSFVLAHVVFHP